MSKKEKNKLKVILRPCGERKKSVGEGGILINQSNREKDWKEF